MDTTYLTLGLFLIGLGFLFLASEVVLPAHGLLFALGICGVGLGVAFLFQYDPSVGLYGLGGVLVGVPALGMLLLYLWPRTPMGRRLLGHSVPGQTLADLPRNQDLAQLLGRYGKALSSLRPAGVVDFDGRRIDALTEGMMVEPGQWVRCVDVRAGRVLVRPVEKPRLQDLDTDLFAWGIEPSEP